MLLDNSLGRTKRPHVLAKEFNIVTGFLGSPLKRVTAQVEQKRGSQSFPGAKPAFILDNEMGFPVTVANSLKSGSLVINDFLAFSFALPQERI